MHLLVDTWMCPDREPATWCVSGRYSNQLSCPAKAKNSIILILPLASPYLPYLAPSLAPSFYLLSKDYCYHHLGNLFASHLFGSYFAWIPHFIFFGLLSYFGRARSLVPS